MPSSAPPVARHGTPKHHLATAGIAALVAHATKPRDQQAYEAARGKAAQADLSTAGYTQIITAGVDSQLLVVYAYGVAVYGFYTLYGDPALCPEAKGAPFYALMRVLVWAYVVVPTGDVIMYVRARARAREWTHNYDVAQVRLVEAVSHLARWPCDSYVLPCRTLPPTSRPATASRCRGCP